MDQTPEQISHNNIYVISHKVGWPVQSKDNRDLSDGIRIALRETNTAESKATSGYEVTLVLLRKIRAERGVN
jgi:hypothetical protein